MAAAAPVNSQSQPFYVDGDGWLPHEQQTKSISVNYGESYAAQLSYDSVVLDAVINNADLAAFVCSEFYNGVWVPCFDDITYARSFTDWQVIGTFYRSGVAWSTLTSGVTMIEFSLVFFQNTTPYTLLNLSTMRYNILYSGVSVYDVGVDVYDGTSNYVALHYIDDTVGYCYYYQCTPFGLPAGGEFPTVPGGGLVYQTGLLDWVANLPVVNVFAGNIKAFIAPFYDRFITPLQFDTTPLLRMRDYLYFVGVVFSTLDPVINMSLLASVFVLVFALAFLYLFISVWSVFRSLI